MEPCAHMRKQGNSRTLLISYVFSMREEMRGGMCGTLENQLLCSSLSPSNPGSFLTLVPFSTLFIPLQS